MAKIRFFFDTEVNGCPTRGVARFEMWQLRTAYAPIEPKTARPMGHDAVRAAVLRRTAQAAVLYGIRPYAVRHYSLTTG
ncbi:MAG: hypothetical protein IJV22_06960 [Bacteroidales bacterium]|nr:hypothetical protein [Bacteroidales bacterium]